MSAWAAFRWNTKAASVVLAYRDYGRFDTRDLARRVLLDRIDTEITGWRRSRAGYRHELLPKLVRARAALRGDPTADRADIDGLRFVLVSPEQLACEHADPRFFLCDCLTVR